MSFKLLLEKFDAVLRKYNPVNYARLQSPLLEKEIDDFFSSYAIPGDEKLKQIWSWKNGFDFFKGENARFQIFYYGALLSLEHLGEYLKKRDEPKFDSNDKLVLLPLTTNGRGERLFFNTTEEQYGRIYLEASSILLTEETVSYYDSLDTMIQTTIKAYEKGIFKYNKVDNWLDRDTDEYYVLAKELNPISEYWKSE